MNENELMNEWNWMNEWMNENEWINEWMNEWKWMNTSKSRTPIRLWNSDSELRNFAATNATPTWLNEIMSEKKSCFENHLHDFLTDIGCPRRHGLGVRAIAWKARGPGFDSSPDQMVFLLSSGLQRKEKIHPDMRDCVLLPGLAWSCVVFRIHVDKR